MSLDTHSEAEVKAVIADVMLEFEDVRDDVRCLEYDLQDVRDDIDTTWVERDLQDLAYEVCELAEEVKTGFARRMVGDRGKKRVHVFIHGR